MPLPSPSLNPCDLIPNSAFESIDQLTASIEDLAGDQVRVRAREARTPDEVAYRRRTGVTKANRNDRYFCPVVEHRTVQIHPIPQAIATCIVPRDTRLMDFAAWRLTDDQ